METVNAMPMDAVLAKEDLLGRERLRELQTRSDGASVRRLLAQSLIYFGSCVGLILVDEPAAIAAGVLVNAVISFAMFGMLHEACHKSAFTRPWASILAGWIAALAQPMSPALMRAFHFEHHRHTHELERDPELAGMEFMAAWPRGVMWIVNMSGLPLLFARFGWSSFAALVPAGFDRAWTAVLPFVAAERRRRIGWEGRALIAVHGLAIAAAFTVLPGLLWVYLGMALGHMFLSWYITCEHRGLALEGSVLERTRSLDTPGWLRWLIWNMPYHAEHHGWPAVPWHALPQLHEEVREHLVHRERPLWLHLHGGRGRADQNSNDMK